MISIAASTVAPASAANNVRAIGQQETLNDHVTGALMIGYTVSGLSPSSVTMPYPVNGRLYEATVIVDAPLP